MLGECFVDPDLAKAPKKTRVTTAMIIFMRYYQIRISGIHLIEEEMLEKWGSVTTGSAKEDVAIASSVRTANFTIAGMAVLVAQGATFVLSNPEAADEIFDVIQRHLRGWMTTINASFNRRSAPMEGLRELEALAEYLYPFVMRHRNATEVESHLFRSLRDRIGTRSLRRTPKPARVKGEEPALKPYQPYTTEMDTELKKRGG